MRLVSHHDPKGAMRATHECTTDSGRLSIVQREFKVVQLRWLDFFTQLFRDCSGDSVKEDWMMMRCHVERIGEADIDGWLIVQSFRS